MSNALVNSRLHGPRRGPGLAAALSVVTLACASTCWCAQTAAQKPAAAPAAKKASALPASKKKGWTVPHTKWGDPDLQGVWEGFESLPLERPTALGDKKFYTDAEIAERVAKAEARAKQRDALIAQGKVEHEGFRAVPNYNAIFGYSGTEGTPHFSNRTSAIIDPPDGRIPPWTLEQVKYWEEREALTKGRGETDTIDDINLNTRCISVVNEAEVTNWGLAFGGANATAPGRPDAPVIGEDVDIGDGFGTNASPGPVRQILQSPGYVAFVLGDTPVYRIVPLNGRPHPSAKIREWMGDARGHWEGDTLVVDITNISFGSPIIPNYGGAMYPGSRSRKSWHTKYTHPKLITTERRTNIIPLTAETGLLADAVSASPYTNPGATYIARKKKSPALLNNNINSMIKTNRPLERAAFEIEVFGVRGWVVEA